MRVQDFFLNDKGGAPTIDWLVILGGLTASGVALVEITGDTLSEQSTVVRGELQDNVFETAWVDSLPVGPSGQGMPGILEATNTSADTGGDSGTSGSGDSTSGDGTSGDGTSGGSTTSGDTTSGGTTTSTTDTTRTDGDGTETGGSTDGGSTDDGSGTTNGNNGHGNDADGNDNSNPGMSNDVDDHTDDDGLAGQSADSSGAGYNYNDPYASTTTGTTGTTGTSTTNVAGCPSNAYSADPVARTAASLVSDRLQVQDMTVGGASTHLTNCPGIDGSGYFHANPTFTLDLADVGPDIWRFQVAVRSSCDTTLLIQDAAGNFYFDDNSGQNQNGRIRIFDTSNLEGRVNIWVGTNSGESCGGTDLIIRAWD